MREQINLRLESNTVEVLEAAIYLRRHRGMQELLGPVIEEFAQQLADDETVRRAMQLRGETDV